MPAKVLKQHAHALVQSVINPYGTGRRRTSSANPCSYEDVADAAASQTAVRCPHAEHQLASSRPQPGACMHTQHVQRSRRRRGCALGMLVPGSTVIAPHAAQAAETLPPELTDVLQSWLVRTNMLQCACMFETAMLGARWCIRLKLATPLASDPVQRWQRVVAALAG